MWIKKEPKRFLLNLPLILNIFLFTFIDFIIYDLIIKYEFRNMFYDFFYFVFFLYKLFILFFFIEQKYNEQWVTKLMVTKKLLNHFDSGNSAHFCAVGAQTEDVLAINVANGNAGKLEQSSHIFYVFAAYPFDLLNTSIKVIGEFVSVLVVLGIHYVTHLINESLFGFVVEVLGHFH